MLLIMIYFAFLINYFKIINPDSFLFNKSKVFNLSENFLNVGTDLQLTNRKRYVSNRKIKLKL